MGEDEGLDLDEGGGGLDLSFDDEIPDLSMDDNDVIADVTEDNQEGGGLADLSFGDETTITEPGLDLSSSLEEEDERGAGVLFETETDEDEVEDSLIQDGLTIGDADEDQSENVLSVEFGQSEEVDRAPAIDPVEPSDVGEATITQQVGLSLGTQVVKKLEGGLDEGPPEETENISFEMPIEDSTPDFSSQPVNNNLGTATQSQLDHSKDLAQEQKEFMHYYEAELVKLKATIEQLREGRQDLTQEIADLKEENIRLKKENLVDQASVDEKNIELSLLKKRYGDQIDALTYELRLNQDKRVIAEEKVKLYQSEFSKLNRRVKIDFKKMKGREAELEHQLELLKTDTEIQLRNRDGKILDLKRKIDALEFDIESLADKDMAQKEEHFALEDKIDKAMSSLKLALGVLQDDETDMDKYAAKLKLQALKKKNMDI